MGRFSRYEYRKQPGFDMNTFAGANQAIPMKTLVIHCVDPRASEIPKAVAEYLGDEVYPGEIITDDEEAEAEETVRDRCAVAGIPLYLRIDAAATPPTLSLYTAPENDEYQGLTRIVAGDELRLPHPFGISLDTTTLPLG